MSSARSQSLLLAVLLIILMTAGLIFARNAGEESPTSIDSNPTPSTSDSSCDSTAGELDIDCARSLSGDHDGDSVLNIDDTCPDIPDPSQHDSDLDGTGDACDSSPDF